MVTIARKAEEVGLDVFANSEHYNPPFVPAAHASLAAAREAREPVTV